MLTTKLIKYYSGGKELLKTFLHIPEQVKLQENNEHQLYDALYKSWAQDNERYNNWRRKILNDKLKEKNMALLMTPTLWNSIDWYHQAPLSWKKRAYTDLYNTLARKWSTNKAVERGMAFEKAICYGDDPMKDIVPDLQEKFTKAYTMIHADGHDFQHKVKKIMIYDGKEFILYGKTDVYFPSMIYDLKTTGNWKGKQKYLKTWQHKVYCYAANITSFMYIVFIFNDAGILSDIQFIPYVVDDMEQLGLEIKEKLISVVQFLRSDKKLKDAYMNKFNLYN